MPYEMSCKLSAISPAVFLCKYNNVSMEFCTCKFCLLRKPFFRFMPCLLNIIFQFVFVLVVADYISSAEVGFPIFKYGTEVQKNNVVFLQGQVRWIFIIRF